MEDLNVVDSINGAGTWLVRNQELLLSCRQHRCGHRDCHYRYDRGAYRIKHR